MRQLFGLIALPFLLAAAPPQPAPVLTGQVVDGDGRPVAGARCRRWRSTPRATAPSLRRHVRPLEIPIQGEVVIEVGEIGGGSVTR